MSDTGERIGRAEYNWDMLGGNWQLDAEAAFNRLDPTGELFSLDPAGQFGRVAFPGATGGVTEDRNEAILNHSRTLAGGLTLQLGAGGEYSQLEQAGAGGLTRTFWPPKGSATLAWTPETGLDISLQLARTVGQLSFGDSLAGVNLAQGTANVGNAQLVPQQAGEADLEVRKGLGKWGSASVRAYAELIDDFIDYVPIGGGLEARGNIDGALRLGVKVNATINLDPIGWPGAQVTFETEIEDGKLDHPLTGLRRPFSEIRDFDGEISLRYDVPGSNWALGAGFEWVHIQPAVRLNETSIDYEGPIYTFGFIEHKDVFGLTVNLNIFNITDGRSLFSRIVHTGPRDSSPVSFTEHRDLSVQTIFRLTVKGSF